MSVDRLMNWVKNSITFKCLIIGFVILVLQIPLMMIEGVVHSRDESREEAEINIATTFGEAQEIRGPVLEIPFRTGIEREENGKKIYETVTRTAVFLPEDLQISGQLQSETRYRGIFKVPVYKGQITLQGHFIPPSFEGWDIVPSQVLFTHTKLIIGIKDPKGLQQQVEGQWGSDKLTFEPGDSQQFTAAISAHVGEAGMKSASLPFKVTLNLGGSVSLMLAPYGRNTVAKLQSDWPDPGFEGGWLPVTRDITSEGFNATWTIPHLGRAFSQRFVAVSESALQALFGVRFVTMLDFYRMSLRAIKYQILFLTLTFLAVFLFEILGRRRIHPIQYVFIGIGMGLFYLLQVAFAEHIGFVIAYILAAALIVALVSGYTISVLGSKRKALIVTGILVALYGFLYLLLMVQDYAMIFGASGLVIALGITMYLTRGVDWYAAHSDDK